MASSWFLDSSVIRFAYFELRHDSSLQSGHYSSLPVPNLQPTASQERNDQYGNQHYSHELLMMGIVKLETY